MKDREQKHLSDLKQFKEQEIALNYQKESQYRDMFIHSFEVYGGLKVTMMYSPSRYGYTVQENESNGMVETHHFDEIEEVIDFCKLRPVIKQFEEKFNLVQYDNFWIIRDRYGRTIFTLKMIDRRLHVKYLNNKPRVYKKFFGISEFYITDKIFNNDFEKALKFYKQELLFKYPMFVKFKEIYLWQDRGAALFEIFNHSGHFITKLIVETGRFRPPGFLVGKDLTIQSRIYPFGTQDTHNLENLDIMRIVESDSPLER